MKAITAILILSAAVYADQLAAVSQGGIKFAIDSAVFSIGSPESVLLEVYQEIELTEFASDEDGNVSFTTEVSLENMQGDTLGWDIWNTSAVKSTTGSAVNCAMLQAVPGEWLLSVRITDMLNGREGVAQRALSIIPAGNFSDVEMARTIMHSVEGSENTLLKGNRIVFPAASTTFFIPGETMIYTYHELYSLGGRELRRQCILSNAEGVPVYGRPAEPISIPEGVETAALVDSIDISGIREAGLYTLSLCYTENGDTLYMAEKPMIIDVVDSQTTGASETASAVQSERLNEFLLILTSEERNMFERLDDAGRSLYYRNYWQARPEELALFLEKCEFAENRYGGAFREGWQTDRGRVYLIYGEPDDIEANPFSTTQAPYEIWYYYGNVEDTFVFADLMGNGDFTQIYSSIAGEISYSNWMNMLQNINSGAYGSQQEEGMF